MLLALNADPGALGIQKVVRRSGYQEHRQPRAANTFGLFSPLYFGDTVSYDIFLVFSMVVTPWTMPHANFSMMGSSRLVYTEEENTKGHI